MDIAAAESEASHEVAVLLGRRAERETAQFVSAVEELSLRLVEEAAAYFPENPLLNVVDQSIDQIHRGGRRLPQVVGWLTQNAAYISVRTMLVTADILERVAGDPEPLPESR